MESNLKLIKNADDRNKLIEAVKTLMKHYGNMSEAELARRTGIPKTTVYKILTGETSDPRGSTLTQLASFFNVSMDELMGLVPLSMVKPNVAPSRSIPVISWNEVIKGNEFCENLTPNNWEKWATIDTEIPQAYALISRPSMRPCFPSGTMLVIDPNLEPQDGDYVVVHYPETKEATLRELSIDGRTRRLLSLEAEAERETIDDSIDILGVLVQSRFSYRERD